MKFGITSDRGVRQPVPRRVGECSGPGSAPRPSSSCVTIRCEGTNAFSTTTDLLPFHAGRRRTSRPRSRSPSGQEAVLVRRVEDEPLGLVDPAREPPAAAQTEAAVGGLALAATQRGDRRGEHMSGRRPVLRLRLLAPPSDHVLVGGPEARHPPGRPARPPELARDVGDHLEVEPEPAEPHGRGDAEHSCRTQIGDGRGRDLAELLAVGGAFAQLGSSGPAPARRASVGVAPAASRRAQSRSRRSVSGSAML